MHTLIVVAHPDEDSLTHHAVRRLSAEIDTSVEVADLAAEGFDPRFGLSDRRAYLGQGSRPLDVVHQVQRLEQADHLVIVFPTYWWSMPALMKGWIDRVFTEGFAFTTSPEPSGDASTSTRIEPALQWLTIHFVAVAATRAEPFARHGYEQALRTQLLHGFVDYCGAKRGTFALVDDSEGAAASERVEEAVKDIASALRAVAHAP